MPPERNAVIICTGRTNSYIDNYIKKNKLVLNFPDYEDPGLFGSFNGAHARVIIRFVRSLPKTVTDVYVCCSKGGSRSAAVAAALLRMSGRNDASVWDNPYYVPNKLVYYRLCREYGLFVTRLSVWIKTGRNHRAYRRLQQGEPCKYERWQIIE